ncbi:sulfurtransferase [Thioalkalivibrio denitrificans]|uniref:Sulfurtransferase n=2 Tax=Thioalkalivibrio denitrificans TaxID=108003 RepID=A0A1V3NIH2_9GAMM|nr:rhodanese-like domain-containing protein [Thioalkalivibrio denitrificans]OOG24774.1 sulfurtransferase [Thioalkalivibrio denitrificans]
MTQTMSDLVQTARQRIREIGADDLHESLESGQDVVIVDVREPYEYEKGHIPDSVLVPRGLLEAASDPNTPHRIEALYSARERLVVLVCGTGGRSAMAADTLQQLGFSDVRSLAGGMKMWEAEEYPVAQGAYAGSLP